MMEDGLENFSFELIEECLPQELNQKEQYFISFYSSDTLGYNISKGVNRGTSNHPARNKS